MAEAGMRVEGAEQLASLGFALQAAPMELRRDLYRGLNRAVKPLRQAALDNIAPTLPSRGGLADAARQGMQIRASRRMRGRNPGIRINARHKNLDASTVRQLDRGRVRHPLFGNRNFWYTTQFTTGWFTEPMQAGAPAVRQELMMAMTTFAGKLAAARAVSGT